MYNIPIDQHVEPVEELNLPENTVPECGVVVIAEAAGGTALGALESVRGKPRIEVPDQLLSAAEVNEWAKSYELVHKTRGTYHTEDGEAFVYIKGCLGVETEGDLEPALAVVRYLTARGILHPDTQWGAFKRSENDFQLFPVSPGINPADLEALLTQPERFTTLRKKISEEDSQIREWVRRLDPDYPSSLVDGRPAKDSLLHLLNVHEASHPDNWGCDDTGKFYPVDVEVIDLRHRMDLVHRWYEKQKLPR